MHSVWGGVHAGSNPAEQTTVMTKVEKIKKLLELKGVFSKTESMINSMFEELVAIFPEEDIQRVKEIAAERNILESFATKYSVFISGFYDKHFTEEQIDQLITFFSSELGIAYVAMDEHLYEDSHKYTKKLFQSLIKSIDSILVQIQSEEENPFSEDVTDYKINLFGNVQDKKDDDDDGVEDLLDKY